MEMTGFSLLFFFLMPPAATGIMMLLVHSAICRIKGERAFLNGVVAGFAVGLVFLVAAQAGFMALSGFSMEGLALAILVNIPFYFCLSYCYYNFVNLGHASIRIRIYAECLNRGGGIGERDLRNCYNVEKIKQARIRRLLEAGDMIETGGIFRSGRKRLVPIAATVFFLKWIVLRKQSEFDEH